MSGETSLMNRHGGATLRAQDGRIRRGKKLMKALPQARNAHSHQTVWRRKRGETNACAEANADRCIRKGRRCFRRVTETVQKAKGSKWRSVSLNLWTIRQHGQRPNGELFFWSTGEKECLLWSSYLYNIYGRASPTVNLDVTGRSSGKLVEERR